MKKLTYIFAATLFMVACNNEGLVSPLDGENVVIKFNSNLNDYDSQVVSRLGETSFDEKDQVALWANVSEGTAPFTGREILKAGTDGSLSSDKVLTYQDDNTVFFSALYPASLCTDNSKPVDITLNVESDGDGYQSLPDLIYATATGSTANPNVNFTFKRQLAKVCVAVKNEDVDLEGAEVFVKAKSGGVFNLTDVSVTVPADAEVQDYKIPLVTVADFNQNTNYGSTIVAPQTLEGECIGIKLKDQETKYVSFPSIVLDRAKKYIFNITTKKINEGDVEISIATEISEEPWISDEVTVGEVEVDKVEVLAPGENIITNSDFESGISPWIGWGNSSTREQSLSGEGYGSDYSFKITNPSKVNPWEAQVAHDFSEQPLIQGATYRLEMDIKGSVAGSISAALQKMTGYKGAGDFPRINITTEWTHYEGDVVVAGEGADHADRFLINIGDYVGTIYIDNVTLCQLISE